MGGGAVWSLPGGELPLDRPRVVGILNLTPDSFSDGGLVRDVDDALERAHALVADGADIVDVGGESTRPGAAAVPEDDELRRVLPFVREAAGALGVPLSVDTRKASVARAVLAAGASVINDVSGLAHDPEMGAAVAAAGAGLVLMHMRGEPDDMAGRTTYGDVVSDVREELARAMERAESAGVVADRVVIDPGLGFAKTAEQSLALLGRLSELARLGRPLFVGPSRKSFIGAVLGVPPGERVAGTVAACVTAYLQGARIFRVHDVRPAAEGLAVAHAITAAPARVGAEAGGDSKAGIR